MGGCTVESLATVPSAALKDTLIDTFSEMARHAACAWQDEWNVAGSENAHFDAERVSFEAERGSSSALDLYR